MKPFYYPFHHFGNCISEITPFITFNYERKHTRGGLDLNGFLLI